MGKAGRPRAMYQASETAKYPRSSRTVDLGVRYAAKVGRKSEDVTKCMLKEVVRNIIL